MLAKRLKSHPGLWHRRILRHASKHGTRLIHPRKGSGLDGGPLRAGLLHNRLLLGMLDGRRHISLASR